MEINIDRRESSSESTYLCTECSEYSIVIKNDKYVCFNCSKEYNKKDYGICQECENLYHKSVDDLGMCPECEEKRYRKF